MFPIGPDYVINSIDENNKFKYIKIHIKIGITMTPKYYITSYDVGVLLQKFVLYYYPQHQHVD